LDPFNPSPSDPSPLDPSPLDPSPLDPSPLDPSPLDPSPFNPSPFNPRQAQRFSFMSAQYLAGEACFWYRFDQSEPLCERVRFPGAPTVPAGLELAFERSLQLAHAVIGVSYYKAGVPSALEHDQTWSSPLRALVANVYLFGLAEFAHNNALDLRPRLNFPAACASLIPLPEQAKLGRRALVALGGGKDSLVSIEALRKAGEPLCAAWIGQSELIAAVAQRTGLPGLNLERHVDPQLFAYNRAGAYNGHVPVTAINSALLVLAALLYGYDRVIFSNEASASSPNLERDGLAVNHQWSKGEAFEAEFSRYVHTQVHRDLHYFSLLRPYSELAITRKFAQLTRYFELFSSCNRNFKILGERADSRWCGVCPKCLFVFAGLAPFMAKPALTQIFGRNLLDDPELIDGYAALLEWDGRHKPFECVGEARETRAALAQLVTRPDWAEDAIVRYFARAVLPALEPQQAALEPLLRAEPSVRIPSELLHAVDQL